MDIEIDGQVVVMRAQPIAPGSTIFLQPGDIGRVVEITGDRCAAAFYGVTAVLPLADLQPLREGATASRGGAG